MEGSKRLPTWILTALDRPYLMTLLGDNSSDYDYVEYDFGDTPEWIMVLRRIMVTFFSGIFLLVGVPVNILAIMMLHTRALRRNLMSTYLISLGILDLCCLLVGVTHLFVLGLFDYDYRNDKYLKCMSAWIKSRKVNLCMLLVAMAVAAGLGVVTFKGIAASNWDTSSGGRRCYIKESLVLSCGKKLLSCMLPMALLLAFSFLIYHDVRQQSSVTRSSENAHDFKLAYRDKHLAILLTAIFLQFLITNMPHAVLFIIEPWAKRNTTPMQLAIFKLGLDFGRVLMYGGYSTNCMFYCMFSSRFRYTITTCIYEKSPFDNYFNRQTRKPGGSRRRTLMLIETTVRRSSRESAVNMDLLDDDCFSEKRPSVVFSEDTTQV